MNRRGFFGDLLPSAAKETEAQAAEAASRRLYAVCCWRESVVSHDSPTAIQMRADIQRMAKAGMSSREIVSEHVKKYGTKVVIQLPDDSFFAVPVAVALAGIAGVALFVRRSVRRRESAGIGECCCLDPRLGEEVLEE